MRDFIAKYKYVLRALFEGRETLFFATVDKATGETEYLGAINIILGALVLDEIYFSDKSKEYWGFKNIEGFNSQFCNDIDNIMKLFKQYPLAFIPQSKTRILNPDPFDLPF
ncbi:MAG: hypothetical protein CEE43_17445 [Promethearchaeota archaeon Loki_b32]|nr:MAG: hypothetical protein CEE43_17445 [Candidatus Lokiarchaeota archaeon Loki_b32]